MHAAQATRRQMMHAADCKPIDMAAGRQQACRSRASRRLERSLDVLGMLLASSSANAHAPSIYAVVLHNGQNQTVAAGELPRRFPGPRVGDRRARGRASPQRSLLLLIKR